MTPERRAQLIAYYQRCADYYGERAREAGARYLKSGDRLDQIWVKSWTGSHLLMVGRVLNLKAGKAHS